MSQYRNSDLVIDETHPSPNYNQRIFFLVLHYTAENLERSLQTLTDPTSTNPVSSHYLVPETALDQKRKIFQLVQEEQRAWHAGVSAWQTRSKLNDTSIGVEIVNLGFKDEAGRRTFYPFPDYQIQSVIELAQDIVKRYQIAPTCVVAHGDIAPGRKVDPGPLFPWKKLYENGIGAWFDEEALDIEDAAPIDLAKMQEDLQTYGYSIQKTGILDQQTRIVLTAFQMHFRPSNYSGNPDAETVAILKNLLQKYFPTTS